MNFSDLHSFFTHFPIAFFILIFIIETIRLFMSRIDPIVSLIILFLGTTVSFLSVQTGQVQKETYIKMTESEKNNISDDKINTLENHKNQGNTIMWASIIIFFIWFYLHLNSFDNRFLKLVLSLILVVLVLKTASLGGILAKSSHKSHLIQKTTK